jgi:hypothetical protein
LQDLLESEDQLSSFEETLAECANQGQIYKEALGGDALIISPQAGFTP